MTEDPRQADLSEVLTPGNSPVGDGGYGDPKTSLTEKPPLEAFDFAAPGMPQGWQELADWCSQAPPAFAGEAKTIHFWLNHHNSGIVHRGLLVFKPASPPFSYFSRNRFYGTGYVIPNVPWGELYKAVGPLGNLPAPWVRLVIALRAAGGLAGLTFHQSSGTTALPGEQVGWAEEDVGQLLGSGTHFVTNVGPWILYMDLTTQLLPG